MHSIGAHAFMGLRVMISIFGFGRIYTPEMDWHMIPGYG